MTVRSLHIYPIKGLGGIELTSSTALERGMEYDRRWMLVDDSGEFITQRTDPRMALFQCKISDALVVQYLGSSVTIDLNEYSHETVLTYVWEAEVYAYEVSKAVSAWFTDQLGISCRLVRMVDEFDRYKVLIKGPKQTKVSFADGYPYSIIGTASLEELNNRAGEAVPSNRFRANIIVNTLVAHQEDTWNIIEVGDTKLQVIKPCARCMVINVDQASAVSKKQPLKALATYRKRDNEVYFGANSICLVEGTITVGDEVCLIQ